MAGEPRDYPPGGVKVVIGQPDVLRLPARVFRARLKGLLFETDKTFLLPAGVPALKLMRRFYEEQSALSLLVVGHADTAGSPSHNLSLSVERATSVSAFLRNDADTWTGWYAGGKPVSKAWGVREDQMMLGAVPDGNGAPFYAGPLTGAQDAATSDAVHRFQAFANASRGESLAEDGKLGGATRRALVLAYMDLDETRVPDGVTVLTHGCGEAHPEIPTADGVAEPRNRRVEIFMFDGDVEPPPRAPCTSAGCPEYEKWKKRVVKTLDIEDEPGELVVAVRSDAGAPVAGAQVHVSGPTPDDAVADDAGVARFTLLLPGEYRVIAQRTGFKPGETQATVVPGPAPDAPPAPSEPVLLASADPTFLPASGPASPGGTVVVLTASPLTGDLLVEVKDDTGTPVANATVNVSRLGPTSSIVGGTATTDATGQATIPNLDEATWDVEITSLGHLPFKGTQFVPAGQTTVMPVMLTRSADLVVTVRDNGSAPIADASVTIDSTFAGHKATRKTDKSGNATFSGIPSGLYKVSATRSTFSGDPTSANVKAGTTSVASVTLRANRYKIHPAIGVARVGDHPTDFYIGPETPGVPANDGSTGGFFRAGGKIKRQAARFRVFEYEVKSDGSYAVKREITESEADLSWTVTLANTKASFREFDGLTTSTPRRNAGKAVKDLEIVPGPRTIPGKSGAAKKTFDNTNAKIPIATLGELRTDGKGRLLVLGGLGEAKSTKTPRAALGHYANNDDWFDDISDGPVSAHVKFKDGAEMQVGGWTEKGAKAGTPESASGGAWVLVGPPDFAPHVGNIITLYDVLYDVAGMKLNLDKNKVFDGSLKRLKDLNTNKKAYVPSFTHDIYPFLRRSIDLRWVTKSVRPVHTTWGPQNWTDLATKSSSAGQGMRSLLFTMLRKRAGPTGSTSGGGSMPKLLDDENKPGLVLLESQEAMLEQWSKDIFVEDWVGEPKPTAKTDPAPEELDQAGLENCVGGAFYPGIEASWQIRDAAIWEEPFRVQASASIKPGHFSRQMALPWQADFHDCQRDASQSDFHWWPAQRPDETPGSGTTMKTWFRNDAGADLSGREEMVDHWSQMGFVVKDPAAAAGTIQFKEIDRGSVP